MKYVGLQTQIWRNNSRSVVLLLSFPLLILGLTYLFFNLINYGNVLRISETHTQFIAASPFVLGGVGLWFIIAWFSHSAMIRKATGSKTLDRKENKRVYNLFENLCISKGMKMPKINIIEDDSLNAFASGLSDSTFTVSLSSGIINKLDDKELEGVIAHELTHILNRDVRLLIVSIIFVGIFAFLSEMAFRTILRSGRWSRSSGKNKGSIIPLLLIVLGLALVGYLLSVLLKFAISRKREYLADAGAVEMTKNPEALASALRKVSKDARIEAVERKDVAQLFIENPGEKNKKGFFSAFSGLFASHPPIDHRIEVLEQF